MTALTLIAWISYLAAFGTLLAHRRRCGILLLLTGCLLALVATVYRGITISHLPMRNMYEIFLVMSVLVVPAAWIAAHATGRRAPGAMDALLGAVLLVPVMFIFDPAPQPTQPILRHWLFGPHVLAFLLAYLFLFKAGIRALNIFAPPEEPVSRERCARDILLLIRLGFPLLTLGLALGAWWGKLAWGDCWNWDPKEMWTLSMWLVYAATLYRRDRTRTPHRTAALALLGSGLILCTLLWANLARIFAGLHSYAG